LPRHQPSVDGNLPEDNSDDIDDPEALQKLRQVMDEDTTSAIVEGLAQADPAVQRKNEQEENDRAADEAAKDLFDEFGDQPASAPLSNQQMPTD